MTFEPNPPGIRRRTPPRDFVVRQAAAGAVALLGKKLGFLQSRSIQLLAIARRLRGVGTHEPRYVEETESLEQVIREERRRLAQAVAALPEGARAHALIVDAQRAIDDVSSRLEEARQLLWRGSEPSSRLTDVRGSAMGPD